MIYTKVGLTRSNQVTKMLRTSVLPSLVAAFLIVSLTGCDKKSGQAVVLAKEHIDAALPARKTPNTESTLNPDEQLRPMADDQIAVDGYLMKADARGTSRDPRAVTNEQWIVKVRM